MELIELKQYLLSKPFSQETYPFGDEPMVIKVMNKMYALVSISKELLSISLKADPQDAQVQRSMYDSIKPGYHLNKEHWNTVTIDDTIPKEIIIQMIDESFDLVVKGLKKSDKEKVSRRL
jgi:predicted DNA-binding protein (MmcQ/YjbR family)